MSYINSLVIYECPLPSHSMLAPIWMRNMQRLKARPHVNTIVLSAPPKQPHLKLGPQPLYTLNPQVG